ncbi:MAG: hypothetical protein IJ538_03260 [Clostridia bacterium]|nr:hypothetical protein [Clostridia bacterium]
MQEKSEVEMIQEAIKVSRMRYKNLIKHAKKISNDEEKLAYLIKYFLNELDSEEIKQIDGTSEFIPFIFDYSFLYDPRENRQQSFRFCEGLHIRSSCEALTDSRLSSKPKEYATVFAAKMATCEMLANEFQRLMFDAFVENSNDYDLFNKYPIDNLCKIICREKENCYDHYEGYFMATDKSVKIDRVIPMLHYYNLVTLNGKKYKVDLAGSLMAMDYAKNNGLKGVDLTDFIREISSESELKNETMFDRIANKGQPGDH